MTLADTPTPGSAVPAVPDDDLTTGLEDVSSEDLVMPRITISHKEAKFVDNLTNQTFDSLDVVLLGLVKQRILWDDEVNEGDKPLCKSFDFREGHPDANRFPWATSGFDRSTVEAGADEDSGIILPCASCNLKEWGTNPSGKTPWCSEQHTFPLLMPLGDGYAPALFTVQRTGIKPSKTYLTAFVRSETALYTVRTRITLQPQSRGSVDYAVPMFVRGDSTEQDDWPYFAQQYRSIREFVTRPPVPRDEPAALTTTTGTTSVASAPAGAAPAAPVADDDEEVPF